MKILKREKQKLILRLYVAQAKTFEIHNGHTISGNYITNGAHSITSNNPTIGNIDFSINVATRITITSYRIDFGSKYPVYITRKINEWNVNNTGSSTYFTLQPRKYLINL
ncbi:hypothetical protein H8356DRAFT_1058794 [Neocallimastix lanati (nom. inval.)]|jgi:hypothetical protein|uniref:Uncharacterized protein n=1 Tax=Neocallimastix californiae TaxID=1754190 RepID=A0A1Y2C0N8_9FUNG|nr:hypothetical protein H8356DRAFT_1058794 [Neocallimastix sp. JGI-2020a]ORY40581.1 hypothetical protein LY90DRAFT_510366 [Neocallimastix californiae]|eukprot:ORY40581.1 hypothetical protein LY90DRAFT_510366 [Neocallimastix californiae]